MHVVPHDVFSFCTIKICSENGVGEQYANVDWDELGFGVVPTDYMYMMKCSKDENFLQGKLIPYGNIELSPSAGVLNYGQVNNRLTFIRSKQIYLC